MKKKWYAIGIITFIMILFFNLFSYYYSFNILGIIFYSANGLLFKYLLSIVFIGLQILLCISIIKTKSKWIIFLLIIWTIALLRYIRYIISLKSSFIPSPLSIIYKTTKPLWQLDGIILQGTRCSIILSDNYFFTIDFLFWGIIIFVFLFITILFMIKLFFQKNE